MKTIYKSDMCCAFNLPFVDVMDGIGLVMENYYLMGFDESVLLLVFGLEFSHFLMGECEESSSP